MEGKERGVGVGYGDILNIYIYIYGVWVRVGVIEKKNCSIYYYSYISHI